jgi:hypothetical protein
MPYSISAPTNLVTEAMDAYNAPIQSSILQTQLQLDQQQVQSNALALQNQMGFQQDMQKVWGPGGVAAAEAGASSNDPINMPKLMATAMNAFSRGMPQVGSQILSGVSMLAYRQAETGKFQQQAEYRKWQTVGSALGPVHDQASEDAAVAEVRAQGIDPARYGITGDYVTDRAKLPVLSQMAMSRAQQLQAQYRDQTFAERQSQDQFHNAVATQRLNQGAQRIGIDLQNLSLRQNQFSFQQQEADKRDARAQQGLDIKNLEAEDRSYANASKVQKPELDIATGVFSSDDRTANLPPDLQKSLATLAARQAKMELYKSMKSSNATEYSADDYAQALDDQIGRMEKQGMFDQTKGGIFDSGSGYKFNPPAAPAKAPLKPPLPPEMKDAPTPKGIPAGSKVIGQSPEGKPVWQDPKGNQWIE